MNLGHPAHPRSKGTGDHNLPEKRGQATSASRTPRKTRVVWSKLDLSDSVRKCATISVRWEPPDRLRRESFEGALKQG
jgi:hypothetical protein